MDDPKQPTGQDTGAQPQQPVEPANQFASPTDTYVTPSPEPVAAAPVVTSEKKPSRVGKWLLWGFVVLLLAGLAAFAYWQYVEAQNARNENATLKSELDASSSQQRPSVENNNSDNSSKTTKYLADQLVAGYKTSLVDKNFTSKLVKVEGDYALVEVYRSNSDSTEVFIYKNVDETLVALTTYDMDGWTESEAAYWKKLYGIDAKALGIPVGPQSSM